MEMDTKPLSVSIPENSDIWEGIDEHQEKEGMSSRSEAVRDLLQAGIESQTDDNPYAAETILTDMQSAGVIVAVLMLVIAWPSLFEPAVALSVAAAARAVAEVRRRWS